jgi:hypothetical protein
MNTITPAQAAKLLALASAIDQRTVGEADAVAWADLLDGLDFDRCVEAVRRHYRESTDRLMPAHVRRLARTTGDVGTMRLGDHGEDGITCPDCKLVHHAHEPCDVLRHDPEALARVRHLALAKAVPAEEAS